MRMDDVTIEEHLSELRRLYVEATPRQRLHIAKQRLESPPEHGPNVLVAAVSAVEGFARSIAMHCRAGSKAELTAIFPNTSTKGRKNSLPSTYKTVTLALPKRSLTRKVGAFSRLR